MKKPSLLAIAAMSAILFAPAAFSGAPVVQLEEQWVTAPQNATRPASPLRLTPAQQADMRMWDEANAYLDGARGRKATQLRLTAAQKSDMRMWDEANAYLDGARDAVARQGDKPVVWNKDYAYWLDAAPGGTVLWRAGAIWDGAYVDAGPQQNAAARRTDTLVWDEGYASKLGRASSPMNTAADKPLVWNGDYVYWVDAAPGGMFLVQVSAVWDGRYVPESESGTGTLALTAAELASMRMWDEETAYWIDGASRSAAASADIRKMTDFMRTSTARR